MEEIRNTTVPAATEEAQPERPEVLEEIEIEELAIDGICGVY